VAQPRDVFSFRPNREGTVRPSIDADVFGFDK
jgi:hypothetical protein